MGFEPRPPDCSGTKVSGLQQGTTTPGAEQVSSNEKRQPKVLNKSTMYRVSQKKLCLVCEHRAQIFKKTGVKFFYVFL